MDRSRVTISGKLIVVVTYVISSNSDSDNNSIISMRINIMTAVIDNIIVIINIFSITISIISIDIINIIFISLEL